MSLAQASGQKDSGSLKGSLQNRGLPHDAYPAALLADPSAVAEAIWYWNQYQDASCHVARNSIHAHGVIDSHSQNSQMPADCCSSGHFLSHAYQGHPKHSSGGASLQSSDGLHGQVWVCGHQQGCRCDRIHHHGIQGDRRGCQKFSSWEGLFLKMVSNDLLITSCNSLCRGAHW